MDVATLTAKGQITVLKAVRDVLGLRKSDQLCWELEDGSVRERAVVTRNVVDFKPFEVPLLNPFSPGASDGL